MVKSIDTIHVGGRGATNCHCQLVRRANGARGKNDKKIHRTSTLHYNYAHGIHQRCLWSGVCVCTKCTCTLVNHPVASLNKLYYK